MDIRNTSPEIAALRDKLRAETGKEYWRSLEELSGTAQFQKFLQNEFPSQASEWNNEVERRTFLKLMGASLALMGISGCVLQPPESIVPYVRQPEEIVPGKPLFFATAMPLGGAATGLLVRSNEGRPTKVEGNPDHPASLGATDIFAQASILGLYDPDRSQIISYREEPRNYDAFLSDLHAALNGERGRQGAGLRILTETVTSPTLASQLQAILKTFPAAKWHRYEPAASDGAIEGARQAFGTPVNTIYRFDLADRILSIDSDFLACGPANLKYARQFADRRRLVSGAMDMNRLYAVESTPTNTGVVADHRLAVRPSEMENFVRAIAAAVGVGGGGATPLSGDRANWVAAVVKDLQTNRGKSIVIPGDAQSPTVHALAHAINNALGNTGTTVLYTDPIEFTDTSKAPGNQMASNIDSLRELVHDIDAGQVDLLLIIGGNPVYTTPIDLKLDEQRLSKVKLRAHLGLYRDETYALCHWHIPATHYLEAWSDTRAFDGTVTIMQPLIAPLYPGCRSAHEFLAALTDQPNQAGYDIVRGFWMSKNTGGDFEQSWRRAVHNGFVPNTALPTRTMQPKADFAGAAQSSPAQVQGLDILFRTDPSIYDGRFANNGWLQELPKPLNKLTWDNAALMSPETARRLLQTDNNLVGSKGGNVIAQVVELRFKGRTVTAPVWIMPGQPDDTVTVHLGYGRTSAGRVGTSTPENRVGFDAYALRASDAMWAGSGLEVRPTGDTYDLANTQTMFNMQGRAIVRSTTLVEYRQKPDFAQTEEPAPAPDETLYPKYEYPGYAWGMAIDTMSCVGCNACVVACQAENNVPIVGKTQVERHRMMHWLRIDAYFKGLAANPGGVYFMPIPCMHCENAPCEPVCPVNAAVHDAEGMNLQVYNRCVGTRYCSNNCPYKVRRFNFLLFQDWSTPTLKLMRNPEVSVRSRGVMEKCTFCIQRTQNAKIETEKEGRRIRDGEVLTACQAACPTQAIIFGDINDPNGSLVAKLKQEPRNYGLLAELNTRPRTTYLASVRNPNSEIKV